MTTRIVFLDRAIFANSVKLEAPSFSHEWSDYPETKPHQVVERLSGCKIAISSKIPIKAPDMDLLPNLKMIAIAGTGTDHIDIEAATRKGITVANLKGYAWRAVAEHAIALSFSLARNLKSYGNAVAKGHWSDADAFCWHGGGEIRDLLNSCFAVFGRGAIGAEAGRLASLLGMNVIYAERRDAKHVRPNYVAFDEALAMADVISLHCPLIDSTQGMIDESAFAKMNRKPILINCGRGGLVNEMALVKALNEEQISGAGFDVLSKEPPDIDDPNPFLKLADLPNVIITPHVGWASGNAMQAAADMLISNINAFQAGKPENVVVV